MVYLINRVGEGDAEAWEGISGWGRAESVDDNACAGSQQCISAPRGRGCEGWRERNIRARGVLLCGERGLCLGRCG